MLLSPLGLDDELSGDVDSLDELLESRLVELLGPDAELSLLPAEDEELLEELLESGLDESLESGLPDDELSGVVESLEELLSLDELVVLLES